MPDFQLRITTNFNPERLIRITDLQRRKSLLKRMERIGKRIVKEMKFNVTGSILIRRSGRLFRSLGWRMESIDQGFRLIVGSTKDSTIRYAKIHDTGGMTGRNHATRIPKRSYARLAVVGSKYFIRKQLAGFIGEVSR